MDNAMCSHKESDSHFLPCHQTPLASTPLADDPHSIPYCEIEAIGRQLPHFPTLQWRQVLPPLGVNPSPDLQ